MLHTLKITPRYRYIILLIILLTPLKTLAQFPSQVEESLMNLIMNDSRQQRELVFDETLHFVARHRAQDMATRRYFSHVDPDGFGPNRIAHLAGYDLPNFYLSERDMNFIESIAAGFTSARETFSGLVDSPPHRAHLFGESSFSRSLTRIGVGHVNVPGSPFRNYYVILIAPPESTDRPLDTYAEWCFQHFSIPDLDQNGDEDDPDGNGIPRITEFALNYTPGQQVELPRPVFNKGRRRLELTLPMRSDLGRVRVDVEFSENLGTEEFSASEVGFSNGFFFSPSRDRGFMRYSIYRE